MAKIKTTKFKTIEEMFKGMKDRRKKHPVYYFFHDVYYRIYHFIDGIPLNIKSFIQRGKQGYSSRDTWGFCDYLANTITKGLTHLKEYQHGHPGDLTEGQWVDTLNKIIDTFDTACRITDGTLYLIENKKQRVKWQKTLDKLNKKHKNHDRCMTDNEIKLYEQGWLLFQQYFFNLWD